LDCGQPIATPRSHESRASQADELLDPREWSNGSHRNHRGGPHWTEKVVPFLTETDTLPVRASESSLA